MEDLARARIAILKEIKQIRRFFDSMEDGVKKRNSEKIKKAYAFLRVLVYHMDKGDLTPSSIDLTHHILQHDYYAQIKEKGTKHEKN